MRVALVALKVERRSRRSHLSHLSCLERESESQQAQVSEIPKSKLKIRTPLVPQAYLMKNVLAAGARGTFHAFQEWADPSERATGHSLQHGNFKYVNQELHFKDFGKSIKRENEDSKQLSEIISFPAAADAFVFFGTCENNVNYSFPAERERFWKAKTEKRRKPCKRE